MRSPDTSTSSSPLNSNRQLRHHRAIARAATNLLAPPFRAVRIHHHFKARFQARLVDMVRNCRQLATETRSGDDQAAASTTKQMTCRTVLAVSLTVSPEISAERRRRILEDVFDQVSRDTSWYLHYSCASHAVDFIEAVFRHQLMDGNSELRETCLLCVLNFMELHYSESLEAEGFFVAMRKLLRCSLNFTEYNEAAT